MNVHLTYQSGQSYSEYLAKFDVKISRSGAKRVKISCREQGNGQGFFSFSLPLEKARQLGYAALMASAGDIKPVEFEVEDSISS